MHFVEKPESKPSAVMLSKPRFRTVQAFRRYFGESCQMLCDALNRNLLAVFLGSNLLTGAVNMSLPTLEASWCPSRPCILLASPALPQRLTTAS